MALNYTDIADPPAASVDATLGQFLPSLAGGGFAASYSGLNVADLKFAQDNSWYAAILTGPASNIRNVQLELIAYGNAVRAILRKHQAYVMVFNRVLHGIFGVGTTLSIGEVPTHSGLDWPLVGITSGGNATTVELRWDGDAGNDPRRVETFFVTVNPEWPSPGVDHYINVSADYALPTGGMLTLPAPSIAQFHQGLVCYRVECDESLASGGTFFLHCLGSISDDMTTRYPVDSTDEFKAHYEFYPAHMKEPWQGLRDAYPFFAAPQAFTITAPTHSEYPLVDDRTFVGGVLNKAWSVSTSGVRSSIDPNFLLRVDQDGTGYHTVADLGLATLTDIARIEFLLWAESTAAHAINVGQNRCAHSLEVWDGSWGRDGTHTKHVCELRPTASKASTFVASSDVTGGCYQAGIGGCDHFAQDPGPGNPMAAYGPLLASHPFKFEQILAGFDSFILSRIGHPSYGSECKLLLQLTDGFHSIKRFIAGTVGFNKRRITDGVMYPDWGYTYLQVLGAEAPSKLDTSAWPEPGPAYGLWEHDPEYSGATDTNGLIASMVSASDFSARPYTFDQSTTYHHGRYQRFRQYTLLYNDLPGPATVTKVYPDGTYRTGSWSIGGTTYTRRFAMRPFRFGRTQQPWGGGGHGATIKSAAFLDDDKIALYLVNGTHTATSFFGGATEATTRWRGAGCHVALPEFLQVRNYADSTCTVGVNRDLIHAGNVAKIEDLPALWVVEAEAAYTGDGGVVDSWLPDDVSGVSETDYYTDQVSIHGTYTLAEFNSFGALPGDYSAWGNRCDRVIVLDEHGLWKAAAGNNAAWFEGKSLGCSNDGVCVPGVEIVLRDSVEGFASHADCADGYLYTTDIPKGNSLAVKGQFADRIGHVLDKEIKALKQLLINATS